MSFSSLAFIFIGIYNIWGKRIQLTPLTDISQGIGWGLLVIYGAIVTASVVNWLSAILTMYIVFYVCFITGVQASIRDLETDSAFGANSTAILFGSQFSENQGVKIPRPFALYALVIQVAMFALAVIAPIHATRTQPTSMLIAVEVIIITTNIAIVGMILYVAYAQDLWLQTSLGSSHVTMAAAHSIITFLIPAVGLFVSVPVFRLIVLIGMYLVLLAIQGWFSAGFLRGLKALISTRYSN